MGAVANLLALGGAAEDYARWGYPRRFNFVPGSLELATALLLLRGRTRVWGAVLGALIMACAGVSTAEAQRIKELERENRELRKANEILKLASAFFAQAELDRRLK